MKEPEDLVWDAITESAKKRFDYETFKAGFSEVSNDNVCDNILFQLIASLAAEEPQENIEAGISQELALIGFRFDGLQEFLINKKTELAYEILATKTALFLFDQGFEPAAALTEISKILQAP